ncbi:MAG: TonB-dependent receptor [Desulfobulbaceae bacterium]|nr:TonB-dependent receptor [Desulfobulbaceae bacterium]
MRFFLIHILAVLVALLPLGRAWSADTSLLFVGEDVSVLTIASMRAESPDSAPAIAHVITREEIEKKGYRTLGEALSKLPGFYISPNPSGSIPYLRGLPNSILFLYDSVHLTSDAAKSVNPLDQELSLDHVERIEVIRGPGSVLWGPDAFAGIVNIVPRRGRDIEGFEARAFGGSARKEAGSTLSWGQNAGLWEAFLSLSAQSSEPHDSSYNMIKLTGDNGFPVPQGERMGAEDIARSKYAEAVFNISWQDWLRFSGRWSDTEKKYILEDSDADLRWPASNDSPIWYVRMEMEKKFASSGLRLNAYYNQLDEEKQELDLAPLDQESHISYSELLYDRELWNADGMFTLGVSYRHNSISGAEITKAYPPDFFEPGNVLFLPRPQQTDFTTSMLSAFGQIRRQWTHYDAWLGLRLTDHSEYGSELSPQLGMIWSPASAWQLKLLYGTSYRTPYAGQLVGRDDLEPEENHNVSASLMWRTTPALRFDLTGFWDRIRHQTRQDPYYGGLSDPATQDMYGIELETQWQITPELKFEANATAFTSDGEEEKHTYYIFTLEDGEWVLSPWQSWDIPFETGPKSMLNAGLLWSLTDRIGLSLHLGYEGSWDYRYDKGMKKQTVPSNWTVDAAMTISDFWLKGLDAQLSVKNFFDNRYDARGDYGPADSPPFNAYLEFKWRF